MSSGLVDARVQTTGVALLTLESKYSAHRIVLPRAVRIPADRAAPRLPQNSSNAFLPKFWQKRRSATLPKLWHKSGAQLCLNSGKKWGWNSA